MKYESRFGIIFELPAPRFSQFNRPPRGGPIATHAEGSRTGAARHGGVQGDIAEHSVGVVAQRRDRADADNNNEGQHHGVFDRRRAVFILEKCNNCGGATKHLIPPLFGMKETGSEVSWKAWGRLARLLTEHAMAHVVGSNEG
jgi:hypothetical protein